MFALYDTFNDKIISRHHTVGAAAINKNKTLDSIKKNNGQSSYLPMVCRRIDGGELLPLTDAEQEDFLSTESESC